MLTQEKSSIFLPTIATSLTVNDRTQIVNERKVCGLNLTEERHLVSTQLTRRKKRKEIY